MFYPTDLLSIESWTLALCVVLLLKLYIRKKWSVLKQWNIPHDPPSLYKWGNIKDAFSDDFFQHQLRNKKKYGPIWGYYSIFSPRVVVHDLEILRQVCIKEFSTFPNRHDVCTQTVGKEGASGLLGVIDDQWKRTRATLAPVFSPSKLRQMSGIVDRCVDDTLKVFEQAVSENDGEIVSADVFSRLSMDVICSSAFSVDVHSQGPRKKEVEIVKQAKSYLSAVFFSPLTLTVISFPVLEPICVWLGGLRGCVTYLKNTCKKLIEERSNDATDGRTDLMRLMLESKVAESYVKDLPFAKGLTTDEIIGNAMTMLVAGYETTSVAMNYLAYNLAFHPEIQSELQAEIDELYKLKEGNPDFNDIKDLKFLGMCVNESLRLYLPVAHIIRTCNKDITLSGLTIPKGWGVSVPINALAHDPEYWDDPMEFKPERMRDPLQFHPMVFQPFGMGPRNCIGSKFALMEIKIAFTKILRRFSLCPTSDTPKPPLQLSFKGTTRPKINFSLRIVPRS